MSDPAISVVIPAYKHEKYVGEAVESVLNQSFSDLELVVIDDGSPDRTGEVVKSYAEKDKRVRYFYQENQDAYNALNRGLKEARGSWIAILNSDDVFHPQRLERLWEIKEEGNLHCLFSDLDLINAESRIIDDPNHFWHQWHQDNRETYFAADDLVAGFLHGNFMVTTSNLFLSREAREKVGFFSPLRYLHDYDYIFRVLHAYPEGVRYVGDEKLLRYRLHGGNTLKEGAIKARREDQQVIRANLLAAVPEASRLRVATGADRLAALERELAELQLSPVEAIRSSGLVQKLMSRFRR